MRYAFVEVCSEIQLSDLIKTWPPRSSALEWMQIR